MTETEWNICTDPLPMLEFLRGKASDRKLALFACACRWRVERWFVDQRSRYAVEATEDFVDGLTSEEAFGEASNDAHIAVGSPRQHVGAGNRVCLWYAARAATDAGKKDPGDVAQFVAHAAAAAFATAHLSWKDRRWDRFLFAAHTKFYGRLPNKDIWEDVAFGEAPYDLLWAAFGVFPGWVTERREQAGILRHIIGNPFRPYPAASWPTSVMQLADALYNGQDCGFALHDALLEAGHPELAEHFQKEAWHPKGCCVLDLILDKK